jgi:hypothetical protein
MPSIIRDHRPHGLSIAEGCRLMGLSRSAYYDKPSLPADDAAIVAAMMAICDEFEAYPHHSDFANGYTNMTLQPVNANPFIVRAWARSPAASSVTGATCVRCNLAARVKRAQQLKS